MGGFHLHLRGMLGKGSTQGLPRPQIMQRKKGARRSGPAYCVAAESGGELRLDGGAVIRVAGSIPPEQFAGKVIEAEP
jgi:hypothetical protein